MKTFLTKAQKDEAAKARQAEIDRRRNARIDRRNATAVPAAPPAPLPLDLSRLSTNDKLALGLKLSRQARANGSIVQ